MPGQQDDPRDVELRDVELRAAEVHEPLPADRLRLRCDLSTVPFGSTAELSPEASVIGQEGAIEALRFGLEINAPGQNIYVRGLTGTGRMTLVRRLMEEIRPACPLAQDRCYVHNFSQTDKPRLIALPRGQALVFRRRIHELADFIRDELESAATSVSVQARRNAVDREMQRRVDEIVEPFERSLGEAGLGLVGMQVGPVSHAAIFPLVEGKPVAPEEWEQLRAEGKVTDQQHSEFKEKHQRYQEQLRGVMRQVNEVKRQHAEIVRSLRESAVQAVIQPFIEKIGAEFGGKDVAKFLDELAEDVVVNQPHRTQKDADFTRLYRVNVVLAHGQDDSCPIILENAPTVGNLLGSINQTVDERGMRRSDHLMVHGGSILRADGGYLILDVNDVLREPSAWKVLMRTLRTKRLEVVPQEIMFSWWSPSLKPEAIDVNVKVVLLGDIASYYLLDSYDPDFPFLFKVLADFDSEIPRDQEAIARYGTVLARIIKEEALPDFDRSAVAALVEHGARIAGRQDRLTTRFGRLADITHEAAFIARKANRDKVLGDDVSLAIRRSKQRSDLPSRKFRELHSDGTIQIAVEGEAIGQINGLAVIHAGPLTYGFPTRITASIGPGTVGVINIEREAQLSGAIHTKGFYILSGLLIRLLRTYHPLAFHASVAFEQSYGGIDGDSASSAEICCLLSALTEIPLRQDLAITGAIDQMGNILAIGAVNEKIEGFFDVCQHKGLTGSQGVIIPQSNARDLMLREDVVQTCEAGRFHVYAVDHVVQALEILTGIAAGERNEEGLYSMDTLLGVAAFKAEEYWVYASQTPTLMVPSEDGATSSEDAPPPQ